MSASYSLLICRGGVEYPLNDVSVGDDSIVFTLVILVFGGGGAKICLFVIDGKLGVTSGWFCDIPWSCDCCEFSGFD